VVCQVFTNLATDASLYLSSEDVMGWQEVCTVPFIQAACRREALAHDVGKLENRRLFRITVSYHVRASGQEAGAIAVNVCFGSVADRHSVSSSPSAWCQQPTSIAPLVVAG